MRPENLKTRIFLDSGNPEDTRKALEMLGFLDGQTTNPSLVAKHPDVVAKRERGEHFTREEIMNKYREIVEEISRLIPEGSVSVEVDANSDTPAVVMFEQGRKMFNWIPNAHIKYPTTTHGLSAAEQSIQDGMRVNMTLVFSQAQGAAVYAATKGAKRGDVFISPFIGRLEDNGQRGMDMILQLQQMYQESDFHVEILAASLRSLDHLVACLAQQVDIVTVPLSVLKAWKDSGMVVPDKPYVSPPSDLKPIENEFFDLDMAWSQFNIQHELTDKGLAKFADDWQKLLG